MSSDGKIDVELKVESKNAESQAKKAGDSISKGVESGLKNVGKTADSAGKNVEKSLKSAADSAKSSFGDVGSAAKNAFGDVGDAAKDAAGDAASAFEEIPADAEGAFADVSSEADAGFSGVADAADDASADAASAFETVGDSARDSFDDVGSAAEDAASDMESAFGVKTVAVGNLIADALQQVVSKLIEVGKEAIGVGAEFDKGMSQVAATMGVATDEVGELTEFAKHMGETTSFSASQAASALNFMALAGYDAETSMRVLPTVLNLAAAGNMDLARASDMVTDAQSALGLSVEQAEVMVDQMAKTSSKTNTSVEQLGDAFLTVGGTAKNLSGGTKELSQMLGLLADNGIKGAEGGTALRNVILSLSAPTDAAAKKMEELGLQVFDAAGNMRPMPEIFADLNSAMEPLTQQEKTEALNTIFNKVDLKSANALLGTSAERFDEVASAIDDAAGSAQKMAETQLDNLAGDVTLLESATEGFFISVSDKLNPALRNLTQFGTNTLMPFLTNAVKNFDKMAPAIAGLAIGITTLATKGKIVKTLSTAFDTLKVKVAGSTTAFNAMTASEKAAAIATKGLSTAFKALQSVGIVLAITAAVEAISFFADNAAKASERQSQLKKATDGIASSMDSYKRAFADTSTEMSKAASSTESYSKGLKNISDKLQDARDHQAELADSLSDTWAEVGTNNALVQTYADTIARLADHTGLTAQEQAELQTAVQGLNSVMGTSYSVIDAQNGVLSESTEVILNNAKAWQQNALAEAASLANTELMKQHIENVNALKEADDNVRVAQENLNNATNDFEAAMYAQQLRDAEAAADELRVQDKAVVDEMDRMQDTVAELSSTYGSSTSSLEAYIGATESWSSAINGAGVDGDAFISTLSEMGISTQDLTDIMNTQGESGIQGFIQAYQEGGESLLEWMESFSGSIQESAQSTSETVATTAQEGAQGVTEAITAEQGNTTAAIDGTVQQVSEHINQVVPLMGQAATEGAASVTEGVMAESANTVAAMQGTVEGVGQAAAGMVGAIQPNAQSGAQSATNAINAESGNTAGAAANTVNRVDSEFSQMQSDTQRSTSQMMNALQKGIQQGTSSAVSAADNASKQVADHFSSAKGDAQQAGRSMSGEHFTNGIKSGTSNAVAAADSASKQVADHFSSANGDAYNAGLSMSQGFANGISAGRSSAVNAARDVARAAVNAAKAEAQINSPSKVMKEVGGYFTEGLALGILDKKDDAIEAAEEVARDVDASLSKIGRVVNDGIILDVRFSDPTSQLQDSMLKGAAAFNMSAMMVGAAPTYTTNNQSLNFYGDYQSPDIIAREMRMQQHYGLAGRY